MREAEEKEETEEHSPETRSTDHLPGTDAVEKERSFLRINRRAFFVVLGMLVVIIAASALLTLFIPQGEYSADGTYTQGEIHGIAFWRVITAPFRVFFAGSDGVRVIMISVFLLVMSGVFLIVEKTGGIKAVIGAATRKFAAHKKLLLCLLALIFMAFGSLFGMFEELVTLLPLVVMLALSLGFDTLTGLSVCMMAACFGFSAAITNPFSVGLASEEAGVTVASGISLRIVLFAVIFAMVCGFLLLHVRRIGRDPKRSLTYLRDAEKRQTLTAQEGTTDRKVFLTYVIFFAAEVGVLLLAATVPVLSDYAIPILAGTFLIGGLIAGGILSEKFTDVLKWFGQGVLSMLPAVAMIALASSVKLIMDEGGILGTIIHRVVESLKNRSPFEIVLILYALILFLQIFIGSASAKIFLIMPILVQLAGPLGLSANLIILTYCMADGFTDVILPTNPVLLIGLSMADVSYGKWFRFTWWFQLAVFAVTVLMLFIGVQIGY